MITINLLPQELRRTKEDSPVRLVIVVISVCIALFSLFGFCIVHFHFLEQTRARLSKNDIELKSLKDSENQYTKLTSLLSSFTARDQAVEIVKAKRVVFSKKLYQLSEVLYNGNHPVWLGNLTISSKTGRKTSKKKSKKPISLGQYDWKFNCSCLSDSVKTATVFYRDLKKSDFSKNFIRVNVPRFNRVSLGNKKAETYVWAFPLQMIMDIKAPVKAKTKSKRK